MHGKAERALGFEPPSQSIEEEESQSETDRDTDVKEVEDSEIEYLGPSIDELLRECDEHDFR
jgi:hypothetical protein